LDLDELARRSDGQTPAAIARAVEFAAIAAFREATASGDMVEITMAHLLKGLSAHGGMDRPTVEEWTWDKIILPEATKRELMQLQLLVEDPERARLFGVDPPTGVLLTGPPGTGKTTIAKVLAAQAKCSFYPVSSATITSMWLGESEKNLKKLFQRARENRPSIIFLDEIDAIASNRGEWGSDDREVNQLLSEMDGIGGQRGVFVLAATNRPDQLDPALLRGGRLSRTIEVGLPDRDCRRKLLELYSAKMPLVGVDFDELAEATEGRSPADIKALCQQAALQGMMRAGSEAPQVTPADFLAAIKGGKPAEASPQKEGGYI
jgi:transitional endoplasmic reticulum ATPase